MGVIFSRISLRPRKKKSSKESLEALESDLQSLTKTREESQQCERTVVSILLIILLLLYPIILLVGGVIWLWFPHLLHNVAILVYLLIVIGLPVMLYGIKRASNTWFARRKSQYNAAIKTLQDDKRKILDEVMDTEPYKVAKELLEKYDPNNPTLGPANRPPTTNQQPQSAVRQRRPHPSTMATPQTPHPALQHQTPAHTSQVTLNTPRPQQPPVSQQTPMPPPQATPLSRVNSNPSSEAIGTVTPLVTTRSQQMTSGIQAPPTGSNQQFVPPGHCVGVAPGPPTPVPILPRDRTGFDKVMDFVLGDGPNNRYALVCSECHSHNGMALKDEFEYLSFRCAYCYTLNQAKKSRKLSTNTPQALGVPGDEQEMNNGALQSNNEREEDKNETDSGTQ